MAAAIPRTSDRYLDAELVARLIADQFPDSSQHAVELLGIGWDNELYSVDDQWVFRFPRRAECVPWLTREIQIMAIVSEEFGAMVPRFERLGQPSMSFPYPFVGYRYLAGVGVDQAGCVDLDTLARDIASLLTRVHRIDLGAIPPTPAGWEQERWADLGGELAAVADTVRPLLGEDLRVRAEPYLVGAVPAPDQRGPRRFVHNDICPDHLLVDGHGRLAGLIDFTDAMAGDPVVDFVGLVGVAGRAFVHQVAASYELFLDDAFEAKLTWLSRVLTLSWIADAVAQDADSVAKHLLWVRRAFDL